MDTLHVLAIASIAAAIASVASRYLEILKPLWAYVPARWQWLAPAILGALGLFTPALQSAIASGADPWTLIGIVLSTLVVPIALAAMAGAHAPPGDPPKPPAVPTSLTPLVLLACLPVALSLAACTPREIAKTSADIAVAACQVASADLQDEPEWLKLVCQIAGQVEPFLVKVPRSSPEAQRFLGVAP